MTVKCSVYAAVSPGWIHRTLEWQDRDWLANLAAANVNEDYGYKEFFDTVDTVVLGRRIYRFVSVDK